jgi:hypothetical protein
VKAILVTGSRDWSDADTMRRALYGASDTDPFFVLIHGDCRGADRMAGEMAAGWGASVVPMPAQWNRDSRQAGTERNRRMLRVLLELSKCGYDCEVHAFPLPSSRGTRHMMRIARDAGFTVHDHGDGHG